MSMHLVYISTTVGWILFLKTFGTPIDNPDIIYYESREATDTFEFVVIMVTYQ